MEFSQKLQELRKRKGLTQEELAKELFVSRTAISKWESGRGYPNIDSLKSIAEFFCVTVDDLLSADKVLSIAEETQKQKANRLRDLLYGVLDLCIILLLFLPFFAQKTDGEVQSVSLLNLDGVRLYLKIAYLVSVISTAVFGVLTLALQNLRTKCWLKSKGVLSLSLSLITLLLFIVSLQPYATVFTLVLLSIKIFMLIKGQ